MTTPITDEQLQAIEKDFYGSQVNRDRLERLAGATDGELLEFLLSDNEYRRVSQIDALIGAVKERDATIAELRKPVAVEPDSEIDDIRQRAELRRPDFHFAWTGKYDALAQKYAKLKLHLEHADRAAIVRDENYARCTSAREAIAAEMWGLRERLQSATDEFAGIAGYLKEGESAAACIARNREDVGIALGHLSRATGERDAAQERERQLREALQWVMQLCQLLPHGTSEHAAAIQRISTEVSAALAASPAPVESERERPSIDLPGFVKPDTTARVCFYEQDCYVLSNFSAFRLEWQGLNFDTSEHAYHWSRFEGTGNDSFQEAVRHAPSAHVAFKHAQELKWAQRKDWDAIKVDVMREILRAKVDQHEYVRRKLLATGDRELVEDSWRDPFWGWGSNRDGQNMLGKLWMQLRAELRAEQPAIAAADHGGNDNGPV